MTPSTHLVICIGNEGAEDLQVRRVYRRLPDRTAESKGFLRVIDDSGEDYLSPEGCFLLLSLPPALEEKLEALAAERSRVEIA